MLKIRRKNKRQNKMSVRSGDVNHRDLTTRTYDLRADSYDDKTRSVEAVLSTENRVRVFDMRTWQFVEEILLMDGSCLAAARAGSAAGYP